MTHLNETSCCGLGEIVEVRYHTEAQIEAAITAARRHNMGRVFATTASGVGAPQLRNLGFREIDTFRNPNTGHQVTIWLRDTSARPAKPVRAATRWGKAILRRTAK